MSDVNDTIKVNKAAVDVLVEKWAPVLDEETSVSITSSYKRMVTAQMLENQEIQAIKERGLNEAAPVNATGASISNYDPVLISMVRRAAPQLIAHDLASVQPMTMPTGLIFAMKAKYTTQGGTEALHDEADTQFSGDQDGTALEAHGADSSSLGGTDTTPADGVNDAFGRGVGMSTAAAEALGDQVGNDFNEMAFSIEKSTVTAKSRALKAEYTTEMAQDLQAVHGLNAETELANILSTEILAEINREMIRTINMHAKLGGTAATGAFDLAADADGRWSVEKWKGMIFQIERDSNEIAKRTRRGKGNVMICSSDVASAMVATGLLSNTPNLNVNLVVDDTGNLFAGMLNNRTKVFIDPYATVNYVTVGYKGVSQYDAGIFYCPYVPLQMHRAVGENSFQPKIAFKTRYGMTANPFVALDGLGTVRNNDYYRIFEVQNILS